tara:strand:- start:625 stop:1383 length:759 start_codon:yes stop_codon:yes gene_type:complete
MVKKTEAKVLSVQDIYDNHIANLNERKVKNRYLGNESWFHSSASGMCVRKHYFDSIANEQASERDSDTYRLFRLGDLVHSDIQEAVGLFAQQNGLPIFIENELRLEDLNVRGFIDLGFLQDGILYDIKTCNAWRWKLMFGRNANPEEVSKSYALQIGTYGLWFKRKYGYLNGLVLVFYNKDNSRMREYEIDLSFINKAEEYWKKVNKEIDNAKESKTPPTLQLGVSPNMEWECNEKYCQFFKVCGGGLKGNF